MKKSVLILLTLVPVAVEVLAVVYMLLVFLFVAEVSRGWRSVLVIIAISWILTGISNLWDCLGKKQ